MFDGFLHMACFEDLYPACPMHGELMPDDWWLGFLGCSFITYVFTCVHCLARIQARHSKAGFNSRSGRYQCFKFGSSKPVVWLLTKCSNFVGIFIAVLVCIPFGPHLVSFACLVAS